MVESFSKEQNQDLLLIAKEELASGDNLDRDIFPGLYNISSAFFYQFMPQPLSSDLPEFVYIPFKAHQKKRDSYWTDCHIALNQWNLSWEAGQLRHELFEDKLPTQLKWLERFEDANIYLLPDTNPKYEAYLPLYHLLPQRTLRNFNLPLLKRGIWPPSGFSHLTLLLLPSNFESQLSEAFAHHIWPLLIRGSKMKAFTKDDPIVILSHSLNYWLPYTYRVAEERLRLFPRVECENADQEKKLYQTRRKMPGDVKVNRPLKGGYIWAGEDDAWEATKQIVEVADKHGKLREIIEAVKANRVEDDFSDCWSYAREDFERKLYKKRSKTKVAFVQLDDTVPVHGPYSQLEENLLWEDFIALLDKKERKVVVCLRSGITKVGEISRILGYANHSPVSKALARIRLKAKQYLELD